MQLVDYSKPGASLVYLDLGARPGGSAQIAAQESLADARLAPRFAVVGAGGEVDLRPGETAVVNFEIGVGRGEGVRESH